LAANGDKDGRRAAYEYGVYNVVEKPIDPPSYLSIVRNALSLQIMRRNDTTNVTQIVEQYRGLQAQIEEREVQVIYALLHAANLVDEALSRRMARVASIATKIAHRMTSLNHEEARRFGIAARVYDVGMLALPATLRERRLEFGIADAPRLLGPHVQRAGEVFGKAPTGLLELAATIARSHHERFDGRGYPDGLKAHDISIYAQLIAVAETFSDAVTVGLHSNGSRHPTPLTEQQSLAYIERQTATTFDPEVVEALRRTVQAPVGETPPAVSA
jgi:putative two-component system response regulator